jgi:AbiJ N-terminal domain 4
MKFSERQGINKAKDIIQIDWIDNDLANGIWNLINIYYFDKVKGKFISNTVHDDFFQNLWFKFFKLPLDTMRNWGDETVGVIREWFFNWEWYEIYDFVEFIASNGFEWDNKEFTISCNILFEQELSGYRFIDNILCPITNSNEINEIDKAINNSKNNSLVGVKIHLETALLKLSDRNAPDYRNSIKESISAIESIAKSISGNSNDSLGGALDKIKGKINLHPSLERGFKQIYGYTSDSDGIRHALSEETTCDFEDAKYMLVSSSAFINYLIVKANKADIKF